MGSGVKDMELKTVEVESLGDSAVEAENCTLYEKDGTTLDRGNYLVLWTWLRGRMEAPQRLLELERAGPPQVTPACPAERGIQA
jgi:hypothetical protein